MNRKKVKVAISGIVIGVVTSIISVVATSAIYETKIKEINKSNNIVLSTCKSEKDDIELSRNVYKSLYESEQSEGKMAKAKYKETKEELDKIKTQIAISKQKESNYSRGNYQYKDLSQYEIMTVDEMNEWIAQRAPANSPFIGQGEFILKICNEENIDPKFFVACAGLESGWGLSKLAISKNNYFGIQAYNDSPFESAKTFGDGFQNGLAEGVNWIKRYYYDEGQTTLHDMIYGKKAYCQDNNGNPKGVWIDQIESIIYNN